MLLAEVFFIGRDFMFKQKRKKDLKKKCNRYHLNYLFGSATVCWFRQSRATSNREVSKCMSVLKPRHYAPLRTLKRFVGYQIVDSHALDVLVEQRR